MPTLHNRLLDTESPNGELGCQLSSTERVTVALRALAQPKLVIEAVYTMDATA